MAGERDEEQKDRGFVVVDRRGQEDEETSEPAAEFGDAPAAAADAGPAEAGAAHLPKMDFSMMIHSFAISALYHLGSAPDPETGRSSEPNLGLAQQSIDILEVLEEKTRGNLDADEARLLESLLYDVRMRFVETKKRA